MSDYKPAQQPHNSTTTTNSHKTHTSTAVFRTIDQTKRSSSANNREWSCSSLSYSNTVSWDGEKQLRVQFVMLVEVRKVEELLEEVLEEAVEVQQQQQQPQPGEEPPPQEGPPDLLLPIPLL